MPDDSLIREIATLTAELRALSVNVQRSDERAEARDKEMHRTLTIHAGRTRKLEIGMTRLNLVVFGICGPAALAGVGVVLTKLFGG